MAADELQPQPIAFVQHVVLVMEGAWPEVTTFTDDMLRNAHVYHATYDEQAGTVEFSIFNGGAVYQLAPAAFSPSAVPLPRLGTLVEGSAKRTTRRP